MASIIKANQLQDFGGNSIIGSDGAGNLTTQKTLYPAFFAHKNAVQNVTSNTYTKITFETEKFDTDNAFSDSKFTVPSGKAGKYFFTATVSMLNNYTYVQLDFYKNGSSIYRGTAVNNDTSATNVNAVIDLSASDYVEVYCRQSHATNSAEGGNNHTHFHGYRIGA